MKPDTVTCLYICHFVLGHVHAMAHMWAPEGSLQKSVLSFQQGDPRIEHRLSDLTLPYQYVGIYSFKIKYYEVYCID